MGGFTVPTFATQDPTQVTMSGGSSSSSLPNFNPGFTYAGGGALPGTNKQLLTPTIDPGLTNSYLGFLQSQLGKGLPAYGGSSYLPSEGFMSTPGSLTAPLNPILQQLEQFMSGKGGPGDLPGVLPMWQSEMAAMQQPIEQNLANLKEQFGSQGALGSTEFGSSAMDYLSQTSADELALLTSATQASLPNMLNAGRTLQGIDQSAIDRSYQQFQTDLPQNNPLLGAIGGAAFQSPGQPYQKQPTFLESLMSNLGSILPTVGSAASSAFPNMPGWMSILLGA